MCLRACLNVPQLGTVMREELLDETVKTRLPKAHKKSLRAIAISRHLKVADVIREAIREKIARDSKDAAHLGKLRGQEAI